MGVALLVLAARSYSYRDTVGINRVHQPDHARAYWATSNMGLITLRIHDTVYPPGTMAQWEQAVTRQGGKPAPGVTSPGIGTMRTSRKVSDTDRAVALRRAGGHLGRLTQFNASSTRGWLYSPVPPLPEGTSIEGTPTSHGVSFPHWVAAFVLLLPLVSLAIARPWTRRRRARNGQCPTCGYDLRATPGRCPECGTVKFKQIGRAKSL